MTCCPVGNTEICVDTDSDEAHCGACGHKCGIDQTCCDGSCVNTISDYDNCGVCGNRCGSNEICYQGECVPPYNGSPGDPCPFDTVNTWANNCSMGLECLGIPADGSAGTCPDGEPTECFRLLEEWNRDCVGGMCGASFCAGECPTDRNCPMFFCDQDFDGICYCIPCPIGAGQPGDPCPYGDVNATANDCAAGLECLGIAADGNAGTCPGGEPRECTNLIDLWNIDCVNGNCGASFCSQECDNCDECPEGFEPQNVGSPARCMCVPGYTGHPSGGSCPWNGVNAEYGDCQAGMACLGNDNMGECPSGCDYDCAHIPENYYPDCVDHVCGFSFCADECDAQGNCPQGFEPAEVSGNCYCIPANPGDAPAGAPCPHLGFNASADLCDVFLTCLGNEDAGLCPGGDAAECTGIPAAFNPDCVNGICGYSFCSARCDDQGSCPAGFEAQDENDICYCLPE